MLFRRKTWPEESMRLKAGPPARPNSTVRMPKYIYQPLEKPNSEFRLLQISKHPLTHQPQCSLHKYRLTTCPDYIALSYTWGEPTPTHSIPVDGADLEVRQNLFDFLHAYVTEPWGMKDIEKPVHCWIDQICINQEDLVERSDQVSIMGKIYRQAKSVLVWLGCDPNMIEAARRVRDEKDGSARNFYTLGSHPYFSRVWIIQEIALSVKSPLIVCGSVELTWYDVQVAGSQSLPVAARAVIYGYVRLRERRTLEDCIQSHCKSNCQNPRDKVYGLLGLTAERWRVRIDYTKEVLEIYFDAVAALYEELFDIRDPECLYPKGLAEMTTPRSSWMTLVALAEAIGLPQRHLRGLKTFLRYCQIAYLTTKIRNVQYTYMGRMYTRVQAQSSPERIIVLKEEEEVEEEEEEEEEIEVRWGSITATRRNPLMRDIIPEMGLQLAGTTVESTAGQSGESVQSRDRWWYKHEGKIHYFDC